MIENYYQQLGTPPVNIPDPDTEAAYCLNHAIRATAGLFYWFGIETGIFPPLPEMIPEITGFTNTSPDHRLYRGETMTINCLTTGNARDFKFDMFVCDTSRECFYPVPGLILRQSGNSLSISNVNFRNNWTCLKYDSVCFNTDPGNLSEPPLHFTLRVTASNQYGHSTGFYSLGNLMWIFPNEFIRPNPPPVSGCPLLLVNDGLKFIYENDLLHRSEFPGNQNKIIEDKYVLRTAPATFPDDSTIMLAVKETSVDINYFDQFRLLAADHPEGTELAVTESNDPVIYYPKYLILPSHAELSGKDITKMLNYGIQYPKYITGNGDDVITAGFNGKLSTSGQDSVALILNPGAGPHKPVIPVVKDFAGTIDIQDIHGNTEISDISFAKRIFNSQVTIPVFADKGFNSMDIRWKDDFNISYLAYTGIYYSGFSTQELELVEAEDITSGNILNLLKEKDDMLVQTDSSDQIILRFKDRSAPVRTGYKRSYIFITEGRYQKSVAFNPENKGSVINQTGNEKEHEVIKYFISNYPNPFNPVTFINYGLEIKSNVSLKVYNILGNEVAVVVNGIQNAGEHRVEFDGSRLASGIYFYTLKAGNFVKTRKMLLLK
ncbi:MAG: T9SS type A sorting domain-containing protein [Bacteroidetes bacterium]|nr:T9SS type A sorting domain-containing protein [Bacteroidota bacterium]